VKKGDKRARGWVGECVDIDAMKPSLLRSIVKESIVQFLDAGEWNRTSAIEQEERKTLQGIIQSIAA